MLLVIGAIIFLVLIMLGVVVARLNYIAALIRAQLGPSKHADDVLPDRTLPDRVVTAHVDTEPLEQRLDAILDHLGTNVRAYLSKRESTLEARKHEATVGVRQYLTEHPGHLIGAMKLYRDITDLGLKESLAAVRSIAHELGQPDASRTA